MVDLSSRHVKQDPSWLSCRAFWVAEATIASVGSTVRSPAGVKKRSPGKNKKIIGTNVSILFGDPVTLWVGSPRIWTCHVSGHLLAKVLYRTSAANSSVGAVSEWWTSKKDTTWFRAQWWVHHGHPWAPEILTCKPASLPKDPKIYSEVCQRATVGGEEKKQHCAQQEFRWICQSAFCRTPTGVPSTFWQSETCLQQPNFQTFPCPIHRKEAAPVSERFHWEAAISAVSKPIWREITKAWAEAWTRRDWSLWQWAEHDWKPMENQPWWLIT